MTSGLPATMKAVVTTGTGGYARLDFRDVPVPQLSPGDVLLRVLAAGVNNTDVNLRLGWYSSAVSHGTATLAAASPSAPLGDAGWSGDSPFPLVQGADCCGRVVAVGSPSDGGLLGARVLVRSCMRTNGFGSMDTVWLGSDIDGAFAQYVKVPASEVFAVRSDWTDVELATVPCAYATAENMLQRAGLVAGEHVLVTGASGGVGSAVVQLARRRGAFVSAIASHSKWSAVEALGAQRLLDRADDVVAALGAGSVDLVVDNVAGPGFAAMPHALRRGGRYVTSGAIAGPIVSLDLRDLYLRDIALIGCTAWDEPVFPQLVSYIEAGEIRPVVAGVFALADIAEAQRTFLLKAHVGNFVLVPPAD
ncbi:MAG: zinc-binding dehydrogenase [Actinomycetota bacterium]